MASAAQQAANRANAQQSTGPVTAEGKAKSAKNATTHGLSIGVLHIPEADLPRFREFEANLTTGVAPVGALEQETCRQLCRAAWNLRRLRRLAWELSESLQADPFQQHGALAALRQLARYRASLEMNFYRSLKTIRDLQTRRVARQLQLHPPEQVLYPPQVEPRLFAKLPNSHGDRAIFLREDGFLGPRILYRVELDEHFVPHIVPVQPSAGT